MGTGRNRLEEAVRAPDQVDEWPVQFDQWPVQVDQWPVQVDQWPIQVDRCPIQLMTLSPNSSFFHGFCLS